MSVKMPCLDDAAIVDYVYEEIDPAREAEVVSHIAACAPCADEVRGLRATRQELQTWAPPDAALGFQVVAKTEAAHVLRSERWWSRPLPAWAQVAAAIVLFSAGVVLGALRVTVGTPSPSTEASAIASPLTTGAAASTTASAVSVSAQDLAALEARLRRELSTREAPAPVTATPTAARQSDEAILQQVRTLIRESEQRQQRELTLRTAELVRDVNAQRQGDLARIDRTFGQMEGTTGVQVEQQRQLLNYLMRVSQRQPQ